MRRLLAGGFAVVSLWGAPTVGVVRTTATQALMEVQGYDRRQGCTLSVWPESEPGSATALDCQASGVLAGDTLRFAAGPALQAETAYRYRVTLGSTELTGAFRTAAIPFGRTSTPAFPTDGSGTVVWPSPDFTARGNKVVDPLTGDVLLTLHRPGDVVNSPGSLLPASGGDVVCAPAIAASSDGKQGYHCVVGQYSDWNGQRGGGYGGLYWIEHAADADAKPDIRFYGPLTWPAGAFWNAGGCNNGYISPFTSTNPNVLYCLGITNTNQKPLLMRGEFTGHQNGQDQDQHGVAGSTLASTTWTPVTDEQRTLTELLVEYDASAAAWTGFSGWTSFGVQNDRLILGFANGQQGSMGWVVVFDPVRVGSEPGCMASVGGMYAGQPGCIVAARPPHAQTALSAGRWGGDLHSVFTFGDGWLSIASNIPPGGHDGWGQYRVTLPAGLPGTTSACPTRPADSSLSASDWPSGNQCTLMQIGGDPASDVQPATLGPILPGDQACRGTGPLGECVRFLAAADATHWWVQRQWGYPGQALAASAADPGATLTMVFSGYNLVGGLVGGAMWWNWANDPHATSAATLRRDPDMELAHYFYSADGLTINSSAPYAARKGRLPAALGQGTFGVASWPLFHGRTGVIAPNYLQQHPSAGSGGLFYDARPYSGGGASCTATASISVVSGDLRKVSWPDAASNCALRTYKLMPLLVHSGTHLLADVSPHSPDAAYQYCLAWRSGDCVAGSQSGDLFVNVPALAATNCNDGYFGETADLCVAPQNGYLGGVVQLTAQRPDPTGSNGRVLTYGLSAPRSSTIYWNTHPLPDGRWTLVEAGPFAGVTNVMLARVPRTTAIDSVNRQDFIPFTVSLGTAPRGADNVIVRFGYDTQFRCTSRDEACVAAPGGDPFFYAGDTITGWPAGTASLTIPVLPERIVYWQVVYRDAAGRIAGASATHIN